MLPENHHRDTRSLEDDDQDVEAIVRDVGSIPTVAPTRAQHHWQKQQQHISFLQVAIPKEQDVL